MWLSTAPSSTASVMGVGGRGGLSQPGSSREAGPDNQVPLFQQRVNHAHCTRTTPTAPAMGEPRLLSQNHAHSTSKG